MMINHTRSIRAIYQNLETVRERAGVMAVREIAQGMAGDDALYALIAGHMTGDLKELVRQLHKVVVAMSRPDQNLQLDQVDGEHIARISWGTDHGTVMLDVFMHQGGEIVIHADGIPVRKALSPELYEKIEADDRVQWAKQILPGELYETPSGLGGAFTVRAVRPESGQWRVRVKYPTDEWDGYEFLADAGALKPMEARI